jgi:hypothetical protein
MSSDHDVPAGSQGKVREFVGKDVVVQFPLGEYLFPPGVLYHIGEQINDFKLGDPVLWASAESYVSDVPPETVGFVIGTQCDKLIVDFGTRQLLLEEGELCVAP